MTRLRRASLRAAAAVMWTVRRPLADFGGPMTSTAGVPMYWAVWTMVSTPSSRSTSHSRRPAASPMRSPHHPETSTRAFHFGVIASARAVSSCGESAIDSRILRA